MITFPVMFEETKVVATSHEELLEVVRTKVGNPRLVLSMVLGTPRSMLAFVDPTVESSECDCGGDWDCECEAPALPADAYSVEMVVTC